MVKKKRKDKEVAKLRREVEVLRAQLKTDSRKQESKKTQDHEVKKVQPKPVVVSIRPDLRKTAILTALCLVILLSLYLTQSRWSGVLK